MIGDGMFNDQINRAADVLNQLDLLERQEYCPNRSVKAATFRALSYRETFERTIQEIAYDFILSDQSLIHFSKSGNNEHDGGLSYSYLDCPLEVQSYQDFSAEWLDIKPEDANYDDVIAEWGDSLRQEYEQYVNTCEARPVTPIRYDYAASAYMPGRHPVSHVHFGFKNHIRVATRRMLRPISFVLLVIRQRYPDEWMRFLSLDEGRHLCQEIRGTLDLVSSEFWDEPDEHQMILE
ncbi:hypothetical protein Poly24_27410 [Rosistilla carotiformis]|uniref:DUF2290 domain-containing protein n=1 Tax=Rosistilla carotiformis TaxID=2528017 RepID=A0A518JU05_9BACT|nr:DUF2290 domain-containing protein [Rosistilla carotiformis]QDV69027.1 hypothetical protein Poly24_27410 [Rosistilla carotiformis]